MNLTKVTHDYPTGNQIFLWKENKEDINISGLWFNDSIF